MSFWAERDGELVVFLEVMEAVDFEGDFLFAFVDEPRLLEDMGISRIHIVMAASCRTFARMLAKGPIAGCGLCVSPLLPETVAAMERIASKRAERVGIVEKSVQ